MNTDLLRYIQKNYPSLSNLTWLQEFTTMDGEELFEENCLRNMFKDRLLNTVLHYPIEINSALLPFEVYEDTTLVALGYMNEENQNIVYLKYRNQILINLL